MAEADQVARRGVAPRFAVGAHGVESGRLGAAVEQHGRRQAGAVRRRLSRRHADSSLDGTTMSPSIRRAIERLDAPPLYRRVLARGDDQQIIAVASRRALRRHARGSAKKTLVMSGTTMPIRRLDLPRSELAARSSR